jgi:hypothetical protein
MANNYNGNRGIPVAFVAKSAARLAVRPETSAGVLARDVN